MPADEANPAAANISEATSVDPEHHAALTELNARLAKRDIHLRLYVHNNMTIALAHHENDTTSTIDDAMADGQEIVDELASAIAKERDLPQDWITTLGGTREAQARAHRLTLLDRIQFAAVKRTVLFANACKRTANRPGSGRLRKQAALTGIRLTVLTVKLMRKLPMREIRGH